MYHGDELIIQIPSLTIAAKQWGNPTGHPILALHGWLDNAASFDQLAPLFPEYYWVAIDLPGHGLSDHKPFGNGYHLAHYVTDVLFIADALDWKTFTLVGHSMGAGIALLTAGTAPSRIHQVVALDALGPLAELTDDTPLQLFNFYTSLTRIMAKPPKVYKSLAQACLARKRFGVSAMTDKSIEILVTRGTQAVTEGIRWRHDPQLLVLSPIHLTEEQFGTFLQRITAPTCFIRATNGYPFPEEKTQKRSNLIKNLQVHPVSGGHHVHLDDPQRVAEVIKPFFFTANDREECSLH